MSNGAAPISMPESHRLPEATRNTAISRIPVTPLSSLADGVARVIDPSGQLTPGLAIAVNAEKVIRARSDASLMQCLRTATLCYPDGMAVVWTLSQKGVPSARVPGCDLWVELMRQAGVHQIPVFLLGARASVVETVRDRLEHEFRTPVVDFCHGYFDDDDAMITRIRASGARIVAVAMGSPRQEYFMERCWQRYRPAFYIGVGGSFDVLAGVARRAPLWMRRRGLEWLYRVVRQPSRVARHFALARYALLHVLRRL